MKYIEYTPEKRPVALACNLAKGFGFEYRVRPMYCDEGGCGGPFVDVVISWEKKRFLRKRRAVCCAVIEPTMRNMYIYGDAHKKTMLKLAEFLEADLKECPDGLGGLALKVEFLSHEPRIIL